MTERILGPTGSKRRRRFLWVPMLLVACTALFVIAGAQGVSITASGFELDASVDLSNNAAPRAAITDNAADAIPDDWDRVCHSFTITNDTGSLYADQCPSAGNDHAIARSFDSETTADGSANNASIFTGGGSKDQQLLGAWNWKDASGGLPDKDNLLHAMAARYQIGDQSNIFFGADRFDNSGDAQIGFWFFRTAVCPKSDGSFGTGSATACTGTATHSAGSVPHDPNHPGDILILSDFTNGGTQPTIRVFEFVGSAVGASDGSLNLLGGTATDVRDCKFVSTPDFCASVNNLDGAQVPWLFKNKSGQTTFGHGEFYEGGLNLNTLGLQNECFSSFLAETRSSQSVTATLKDFVLGSFQQCGATLSTTPSVGAGAEVSPGSGVSDIATVLGTGPTTPPTPTGNVTFFLCARTDVTSTAVCSTGGSQVGSAVALADASPPAGKATATSAAVNTAGAGALAPGRYCFRAEWPGDSNYAGPFTHAGTLNSECFIVRQIPTTTTTSPSNSTGGALTSPVAFGTSLYDKAVVAGTTAGGTPLGTVDFFVCDPDQTTGASGSEVCATGGTALTGNPRTLVADSGSSPPTSSVLSDPAVVANKAGVWCFRAVYTPTGGTYTGSSDARHSECVTVSPVPTTTETSPQPGTGPFAVGTHVTDHAVVTGTSAGGTPTGTITFFICDPAHTTGVAGSEVCASGGTQLNTATATAVANSSPPQSQADSTEVIASSVGTWCFRAEYTPATSGSGRNYTGSSDSRHTECFTVRDSTSATSAQNWLPNDSATVTSAGGTALNGSLSFTLYAGNDCGTTGGAVLRSAESFTLTDAASPATRVTTNASVKVTATQVVSWKVVFVSSDAKVDGFTKCTETTSLTIAN